MTIRAVSANFETVLDEPREVSLETLEQNYFIGHPRKLSTLKDCRERVKQLEVDKDILLEAITERVPEDWMVSQARSATRFTGCSDWR